MSLVTRGKRFSGEDPEVNSYVLLYRKTDKGGRTMTEAFFLRARSLINMKGKANEAPSTALPDTILYLVAIAAQYSTPVWCKKITPTTQPRAANVGVGWRQACASSRPFSPRAELCCYKSSRYPSVTRAARNLVRSLLRPTPPYPKRSIQKRREWPI